MLRPAAHHFLGTVSLIPIILIGYQIERHETVPLFLCFFALFAVYGFVCSRSEDEIGGMLRFWIIASIVYRAALVWSLPSLSDDFYRFIWDGRLLEAGVSPFAHVPSYYMQSSPHLPGLDAELFDKLNSQHRFSSYPPVCQLIYWMSAVISPDSLHGSVVTMKTLLFFFELATFWVLARLLSLFRLPRQRILLYCLNPLVIVELTGNLHFEGVMIFFLLLALYFLFQTKTIASTAGFAASICTKLIPLIFLPSLWHLLGSRQAAFYWIVTGAFTIIFFLPFVDPGIVHGFSTSLNYYFQHFEFNASVYYLVREIGFYFAGFNIIQFAGPALAAVATIAIMMISLRRYETSWRTRDEELFRRMTWCLLIYFLSTTILHPWYIITLLATSIFTTLRFPALWSGLIFLTYAGYSRNSFEENYFLVAFEYGILALYILYETRCKRIQNRC